MNLGDAICLFVIDRFDFDAPRAIYLYMKCCIKSIKKLAIDRVFGSDIGGLRIPNI